MVGPSRTISFFFVTTEICRHGHSDMMWSQACQAIGSSHLDQRGRGRAVPCTIRPKSVTCLTRTVSIWQRPPGECPLFLGTQKKQRKRKKDFKTVSQNGAFCETVCGGNFLCFYIIWGGLICKTARHDFLLHFFFSLRFGLPTLDFPPQNLCCLFDLHARCVATDRCKKVASSCVERLRPLPRSWKSHTFEGQAWAPWTLVS